MVGPRRDGLLNLPRQLLPLPLELVHRLHRVVQQAVSRARHADLDPDPPRPQVRHTLARGELEGEAHRRPLAEVPRRDPLEPVDALGLSPHELEHERVEARTAEVVKPRCLERRYYDPVVPEPGPLRRVREGRHEGVVAVRAPVARHGVVVPRRGGPVAVPAEGVVGPLLHLDLEAELEAVPAPPVLGEDVDEPRRGGQAELLGPLDDLVVRRLGHDELGTLRVAVLVQRLLEVVHDDHPVGRYAGVDLDPPEPRRGASRLD
mmetsp:Transcript_28839/g.68703  ORF Transcript_28839/g.68703 Transcript_28839/m.68703 type:complete len:262 (-) Transcript_28839:234-1019(-)